MLSFIKFLNYLNKNTLNLSDTQKDTLHKLLFCNATDRIISSSVLAKSLNVKSYFGNEILKSLSFESDLEVTIKCQNCGFDTLFSSEQLCPYCNEQLIAFGDNMSAKIEGVLSDEDKLKTDEESVREEQLEQMIVVWEQQKFITYLLMDISNSEGNQTDNDLNYKQYLEDLRTIIKQDALRVIKGQYLFLGEIGDCFKIAFSDYNDILPFVEKLAEVHYSYIKSNKFPKVPEGIYPKYCLKISSQLLELPQNITPEALLFKTLTGSLDFNSTLLTQLFRLDGGIQLNYTEVYGEKNYISTWIFDKLAEKINLKAKTAEICGGKLIETKANVAAITFPEGKIKIEENPIVFLKQQNH